MPIQRVEEEDINDQFDRCESLLSDMESYHGSVSRSVSVKPHPSKKASKKHVGMETIKRQMDNLTEMVNDLQFQMESREKDSDQILSDPTMSPLYGTVPSTLTSESDQNLLTTTGEEEDEYESMNRFDTEIVGRPSSKRRNNRRRLRWRSFYTAHQVAFVFLTL